MIVVGKISVKAILENKKRDIHAVYLLKDKDDKDVRYVQRLTKGLKIEYVSREALDTLTGTISHGGYAVDCGARHQDDIEDLNRIFCIEGVSDPYNLGEILRSLLALGVEGVLTPDYDFYEHEAKLIRASAGASEKIRWLKSEDVASDLIKLKAHDIKVIGAHRQEGSHSLLDYQWPLKSCVCIGGALRGLSRIILDICDAYVRLDYDAKIALSANSASTVFAYAQFQALKKGESL